LILANIEWFETPLHVAATNNDAGPYDEARAVLSGTPTDLAPAWYTVRSAIAALIPELQLPDVIYERIKGVASPAAVTPLTYQEMTKLLRELLGARKATVDLIAQILRYETLIREVEATHVLNLVDPRIDALQSLLEELDDASVNIVHLSQEWRRKYGRKFFFDNRLCLDFGMKLKDIRPVLVWKQQDFLQSMQEELFNLKSKTGSSPFVSTALTRARFRVLEPLHAMSMPFWYEAGIVEAGQKSIRKRGPKAAYNTLKSVQNEL
jgi:hypothetical protein